MIGHVNENDVKQIRDKFNRSTPSSTEISLKQKIFNLEKQLLDPSVRRSKSQLSSFLSDDFLEYGSSGQVYNKKDVINSFVKQEQKKFKITKFRINELSSTVVLATYKIFSGEKISLRSSIWKLHSGNWRIVFHQGTNI